MDHRPAVRARDLGRLPGRDVVRGYAFVKDHKILEIATTRPIPRRSRPCSGRVRAEALERAYPEVIVHAPIDHPVLDAFRAASGKIIDQDEYDGTSLDVPHPQHRAVPGSDPPRAGPPRRAVGRRACRWSWG